MAIKIKSVEKTVILIPYGTPNSFGYEDDYYERLRLQDIEWIRNDPYCVVVENERKSPRVTVYNNERDIGDPDADLFDLDAARFWRVLLQAMELDIGGNVILRATSLFKITRPKTNIFVFTAPCGDQVFLHRRDVDALALALERAIVKGVN